MGGTLFKHQEIWRLVSFDNSYEVSNFGRVRNAVTGVVKKATHRPDGYFVVGFCHNYRSRTHLVHRLVLLSFVGEPPTVSHQSAHWDGDKANNKLCNLRWATSSENNLDKKRHGTFTNPRLYGEKNPKSKLTAKQVREIRKFHAMGRQSIKNLSCKYGVAPHSIRAIITRRHWAHVN